MLLEKKCAVSVYILETGRLGTGDFQNNLERLHTYTDQIHFIQSEEFFPLPGNRFWPNASMPRFVINPIDAAG